MSSKTPEISLPPKTIDEPDKLNGGAITSIPGPGPEVPPKESNEDIPESEVPSIDDGFQDPPKCDEDQVVKDNKCQNANKVCKDDQIFLNNECQESKPDDSNNTNSGSNPIPTNKTSDCKTLDGRLDKGEIKIKEYLDIKFVKGEITFEEYWNKINTIQNITNTILE